MFQYMGIWGRVWQGSLIVKSWTNTGDDCSWDYNVALSQCFCVRGGIHWKGSGVNLRGCANVNRESGTGETFRIPICNWGSCVYCLNKALIWLSIEGISLFGSKYYRWTVFLFAWIFACLFVFSPKNWRQSNMASSFFSINLIWPVKIHSSKLYWKNLFSSLFLPSSDYSKNSG